MTTAMQFVDAPFGDPAPMSPASQAATRRSGRHGVRHGFRWTVRTLVVGGLAGAAWLLCGAAAQAADTTATGDLPVIADLAVPGSGSHLRALRLTGGAAHHHRVDRADGGHGAGDRTRTDRPAGTTPVRSDGVLPPLSAVVEAAQRSLDSTAAADAPGASTGFVTGLTAATRLTDGPVGSLLHPVTRTATAATTVPVPVRVAVAVPRVASLANGVIAPVTAVRPPAVLRSVTALLRVPANHGGPTTVSAKPAHTTGVPAADRVGRTPSAASAADASARTSGHFAGGSQDGRDPYGWRWFTATDRPPTATTVRSVGVPGAPGHEPSAPLGDQLAAGSIAPALGSGSPSDGGCAATLPAAVVAGMVACHRMPITTDVEVRRYDAGAPTVSPD